MKYNIFRYIWCVALTALAACSADRPVPSTGSDDDFARVVGDKVIVNASLELPEMGEISSRALDPAPDYGNLHLYLVEFDDNGSSLRNTLRTVYQPDVETPAADRVNYKFTLNKSNQPRILHLIAVPKDVEFTFNYEVEAVLIPSLTTDNQTPAYWRRLSFPEGYVDNDGNAITNGKGLNQLQHVALLRNFACVTMANQAPDFTLTGFAVVNVPEQGSVAPWNTSTHQFPEFIGDDLKQLDYKTVSESYSGVLPANTSFSNQEAGPVVGNDLSAKYMYERPFNSIRHTFVIFKGKRSVDKEETYYKIDIGKNDDSGVFRYFNILRNFKYNIVLKSVGAEGYNSALEAAKGFVYNNLSFDVVLAPMLNISDGEEVVYVNFTNAVITDPEPSELVFQYRYRALNQTGNSPTYNNDNVTFIGLEPGDVIDKVEYTNVNGANGWRDVKIYCKAAGTETKTQTFTIVKKSGLGRQINLVLHRKWDLTYVREYPDVLENWDSTTPGLGTASWEGDKDLTIFFDLPDNLQESMFPLVFTLEADHQNIENNPLGMLVVTYGTSSFNGVEGFPDINPNDRRIKYERTVTWTDYNDPLTPDDPYQNGTAIDNGNGTFTHRVRCRFRTITSLDDLNLRQSYTTVIITNPNFNNAFATFTRIK